MCFDPADWLTLGSMSGVSVGATGKVPTRVPGRAHSRAISAASATRAEREQRGGKRGRERGGERGARGTFRPGALAAGGVCALRALQNSWKQAGTNTLLPEAVPSPAGRWRPGEGHSLAMGSLDLQQNPRGAQPGREGAAGGRARVPLLSPRPQGSTTSWRRRCGRSRAGSSGLGWVQGKPDRRGGLV